MVFNDFIYLNNQHFTFKVYKLYEIQQRFS
jgi:hypothetical protein